jgi:hypothetical protein
MPDTDHGSERDALVERWFQLTRCRMPAMAAEHRWPIRLDHCFMRVCLDEALGAPWPQVVRRPAIHTMKVEQLAAAVRVAEALVRRPDRLAALNERSLQGRRMARRLALRPA